MVLVRLPVLSWVQGRSLPDASVCSPGIPPGTPVVRCRTCNGRVWRIDVGMSSGMMGAAPQVLEIEGEDARVLGKDNQESRRKSAAPVM